MNKFTKQKSKELLRGHRFASAMLLFGGAVLAIAAGFLPLLLDFAAAQAAAALPQTPAAALGLRWGKVAGGILLALLAALLCAPLRMGREAWFFGGADDRKRTASRVLFWFQPRWALKAARFVAALTLRKLVWAVVYLLPGGFLLAGTWRQAAGGGMNLPLLICAAAGGVVLTALGFGFYVATAQRYTLVLPILAKQPRCKLGNALRLSASRTEGRCAALLRFQLSFAPWYLLGLLIVPLIYIAPYLVQARACRHAELLTPIA